MTVRKAPAGLGRRGRDLWRWLAKFEPEPHELVQVLECCGIADRLDALAKRVAEAGVFDTNAKGETVPHAAVIEARQQVLALNRTIAALNIPAPHGRDAWEGLTSSQRARKAALARHYPGGHRA